MDAKEEALEKATEKKSPNKKMSTLNVNLLANLALTVEVEKHNISSDRKYQLSDLLPTKYKYHPIAFLSKL